MSMLELSERAYPSSRVNAGSAFFHAALTWKTPTFLHGRWKRPSVTCFVSVSDLVFNDVSWFEGPPLRFYCNQDLFIKVSMADASKCNYPGACRIVDAYFRLNLSG